ncbi:MAG TPA: acetamidase/formamidase family protein [Solirubrobacterales bacterium]|jgi:formamidase
MSRSLVEERLSGHNRWHPDVPPILTVAPGDVVDLDVRDGMDQQVNTETKSEDIPAVDGRRGHPMTGPIFVEGAEVGDLLEVETVEIEPDSYAWSSILPGFCYLPEEFPDPYLVHWTIRDNIATTPSLPGIAIEGRPFLGTMGVAPSLEHLREYDARERALAERSDGIVPLPTPEQAVPNDEPLASEGLRTVPPRENGGNMDVKQMTAGSRAFFPVDVPGALLSVSDTHFAQGDGESGGSAIEVASRVRLRLGLRKAESLSWRPRYPFVEFDEPAQRLARPHVLTTGISITPGGENQYLDITSAAKEALREMVAYLIGERGLEHDQAAIILAVAVDLRASSVVNNPNALVSAVLPLDIFSDES